jgi:Na+/melibiose symporter-like transporter
MLDMAYFRNAAFSTATGGMVLVFLSMFGVMFLITQYFQLILGYSALSSAIRFMPMAPIMMVVSPLTPRIIARVGANRTVASGLALVSLGFLSFVRLDIHTSYAYVLLCVFLLISGIALTMSPMTAAIMSAVPPRRAGAGSAMNDATRELGAALGVAVLGSVAASRYSSGVRAVVTSLSPGDRAAARTSLAGALQTAARLPQEAASQLVSGAEHAFISGIHFAAVTGAILAAAAALIILRFLPRQIAQHGAVHGPVAAMEDAAELGLAGIPPVFADTPGPDEEDMASTGAAEGRPSGGSS